MLPAILSVRAVSDLLISRQHSEPGYGLVSGVKIGQIWVIDGFHMLNADYCGALTAYHKLQIQPNREYVGIFSCGIEMMPDIQHSGLYAMILKDKVRLFHCRRLNGDVGIVTEELERKHERE